MKAAREPRSSAQLCNFLFVNPPSSTEGKVARAVFRRAAAAAAEAAGLLRAELRERDVMPQLQACLPCP